MKIEHWQSQAHHPDEELNYRNLLGACLGGHGQPGHLQHCDSRKGDRALRWNPGLPEHRIETRLRYENDGSVHSDDERFNAELNEVLNLNLPILKNNRAGALRGILEWWDSERARLRGPVPRRRIERVRDRHTESGGHLPPYCHVAVWWLSQKLERMP